MAEPLEPSLEIPRTSWVRVRNNILSVLCYGVLGFSIPWIGFLLKSLLEWWDNDPAAFTRESLEPIVGPSIMFAECFGLAWLATFTPTRRYRYLPTLGIIFGVSLLILMVLGPILFADLPPTEETLARTIAFSIVPLLVGVTLLIYRHSPHKPQMDSSSMEIPEAFRVVLIGDLSAL